MGSLKWTLAPTIADTGGAQVTEAVHVDSGVVATSGASATIPAAPADFKGRRLIWIFTAEGAAMWVRFDGKPAAVGKGNYIPLGQTTVLGARPSQAGTVIDDA